jgi:hypothetical protein
MDARIGDKIAGRGRLGAWAWMEHHDERLVAGACGSQGALLGQARAGRLGGCAVGWWTCPLAPFLSRVGEAPRQRPAAWRDSGRLGRDLRWASARERLARPQRAHVDRG